MAAPLTAVRNLITGIFVETRKVDEANGTVSVKRLKRHSALSADASSGELSGVTWTDDPTSYIGRDALNHIARVFRRRITLLDLAKDGNYPSIDRLIHTNPKLAEEVIDLNHTIHKLLADSPRLEPLLPTDDVPKKIAKFEKARDLYLDGICKAEELIHKIYAKQVLDWHKELFPQPPRTIPYGEAILSDMRDEVDFGLPYREAILSDRRDRVDFGFGVLKREWLWHQKAQTAAEFISWVLQNHMRGMEGLKEALSKVFVDVNAVHKHDIIPSWIKPTAAESSPIPGSFPTGPDAAFEEVPINDLSFAHRWEYSFPSADQPPINVNEFRPILEPKGILKKPKQWPTPESPKYVATPDKNKRLDFVAPVASYAPPKEVPVQVMSLKDAINVQWHYPTETSNPVKEHEHEHDASHTLGQATRNRHLFAKVDKGRSFTVSDPTRWTGEQVERDDAEMGLRVYEAKYGPFLCDLRREMLENTKPSSLNREPLKPETHDQEAPKPEPDFSVRRQILQRIHHDKNQKTSQGAPGEKNSILNRFFRKTDQEDIIATESAGSEASLFDPDLLILQESNQTHQSTADDDLAIATKKLEDLEVSRQLAHEWENGLRRDIEERHREAERLRKEAERKRREEQRRQEQESRRLREEADQASRIGLRVPKRPLIGSLSNDWEKKVSSVLHANPAAELAKIVDGQSLTKRDFVEKLLEPHAWLNDNVIIGSISHIADAINKSAGAKDTEPKCAAFTSYFYPRLENAGPTQCKRLMKKAHVSKERFFDIDTILIPICKGMHWTLAVVRPQKRTVAHLDSMRAGAGDIEVKERLLDWVKVTLEDKWVASEWSAIDYEAPRQTNGYDCGVFTITNALCIALGLNPKKSYSAGQLTLQRRRLAAVLLNGGFTKEFSLEEF